MGSTEHAVRSGEDQAMSDWTTRDTVTNWTRNHPHLATILTLILGASIFALLIFLTIITKGYILGVFAVVAIVALFYGLVYIGFADLD